MSSPERDSRRLLLRIDAAVNIGLGLVMALVPWPAARLLGAPEPGSGFYVRVLGAVLIGIGLALLMETRRVGRGTRGLGLDGAVAINLCGGAAVAVWLLEAGSGLPLRGQILLWAIVALLVGLSSIELLRARRPGV